MVSVKVCNNSGNSISNAKVSIEFKGLTRGFSSTEYTDSNGIASFDNESGNCKIYVNGKTVYEGRIEGRKMVYI